MLSRFRAAGRRRAEWRALAATACHSEPTAQGWRLRFPADPALATRAAGLAATRRCCCPFLEFTLVLDRDGLTLDARAPADAQPLVAGLFGQATHPGPAADRLSSDSLRRAPADVPRVMDAKDRRPLARRTAGPVARPWQSAEDGTGEG